MTTTFEKLKSKSTGTVGAGGSGSAAFEALRQKSAQQPQQEERPVEDGLLKRIVKEPINTLLVRPAVRATQAAATTGILGKEAQTGALSQLDQGQDIEVNLPLLGKFKAKSIKPGFSGFKQVAGEGLESASYLAGGGAAKTGVQTALKSTLGSAVRQGSILGAKSGAMFGGGRALQEDKGAVDVLKETAIGAGIGGAVGAAVPLATRGISEGYKSVKSALGKPSVTPELAKSAAGKVLQGHPGEAKVGVKVLSKVDTTGVKTYEDLSRKLESHIDKNMNQVDEAFKASPKIVKMNELDKVITAESGGRKVQAKTNFVKDALNDLKELYTKTRNPSERLRVQSIISQAERDGLSPNEINFIAREYGSTFKSKAFNKMGDPLTSVNAVTFENTRKGLKEAARSFLPDDTARALDKEITDSIKVKGLVDKMVKSVNKLEQKVSERNIFEKLFRGAANALDMATFGGPKAFISKLFFPSNVGLKTLNALDLEEQLAKNLKIIRSLDGASDSVIVSTLKDMATKSGIVKATSVFGSKVPKSQGGANAGRSSLGTAIGVGAALALSVPVIKIINQSRNELKNGVEPNSDMLREAINVATTEKDFEFIRNKIDEIKSEDVRNELIVDYEKRYFELLHEGRGKLPK